MRVGLYRRRLARAGAAGNGRGHHGKGTATDASFSSVVFLAGWEGANNATTYSEEKNGRAGSFFGTTQAKITTADFYAGASSLLPGGNGGGVTFADNADWRLSAANSDQFTVETRAKTSTSSLTNQALIWQAATAGTESFAFWVQTGGQLAFWGSTAGSSFDWQITASGMTWATGVWYHLAADKDAAGKVRVYRDGVMVASGTPASSVLNDSNQPLIIGCDGGNTRSWSGWIDETRITKGVARYASDGGFTPPAGAFPRS